MGIQEVDSIRVMGAREHNLKGFNLRIPRGQITVITGVSGSGKSSLAFDTILAESNRRFFYTLSHYTRQFLDLGSRPAVASIQGLSPAIALAQNETMPSKRATVGSLTDVGEILGVLFSKFGVKHCPQHALPTDGSRKETILSSLLSHHEGKTLALCAPVAEQKKGSFQKPLQQFSAKGFSRVYIDGSIQSLSPLPSLDKSQKHDIKILVDYIKIGARSLKRLEASLDIMFELGQGRGEYFIADQDGGQLSAFKKISILHGCPTCGFSWPKLDSRYFSANSLGKCLDCNGLGYREDDDVEFLSPCSYCRGTGLDRRLESIHFHGKSPQNIYQKSIGELLEFIVELGKNSDPNPALRRIMEELTKNLEGLAHVGLSYLSLSRRIRTLSGGEAQRVRLSGVLGERLRGVLYILDEPSQGLSDQELGELWSNLESLKQQGNTVIVVDHDESIMKRADLIIDLGPEGGAHGGHVVAMFQPQRAADYVKESLTARYLQEGFFGNHQLARDARPEPDAWLVVHKPRLNNLKMDSVRFPLSRMSVISGVSGAGKSSLILGVLHQNALRFREGVPPNLFCESVEGLESFTEVLLVDRKPIAKSSVSMPATYLDIFTDLRKFYGKLPDAQVLGLTARDFSTSVEGGRCPECKGRGQLSLTMKFLSDALVTCPSCEGARFKSDLLQVEYKGLNLSQILNLTLDQAAEHFSSFRKIIRKLQPARDLGLGYLKLGQPSSSLSGGESQRLKLAPLLARDLSGGSLVIMDEPTTGLHFKDVACLMSQCQILVNKGVTLLVIEHSQVVKNMADWHVNLGPGSANNGGMLVKQAPCSFP